MEGGVKKILSSLAIISLMFVCVPTKAGIQGSSLDQSYESVTYGWITIGSPPSYTPERIQGFRPSRDGLTSVEVYLKNRKANSTIKLEVRDMFTNELVASNQHTLLNPPLDGWETFSFSSDKSPYITLTPEARYGIVLTTVGDSQTAWAYSANGNYDRGGFSIGDPLKSDAFFKVYTLDIASYNQTPEEPVPANENNNQEEKIIIPDSKSTASNSQNIATVDTAIASPSLIYIEVEGEKTEAPIEGSVEVEDSQSLKFFGTAPANMNVVLFAGDFSFSSQSDAEGNWMLEMDHSTLSSGEFVVKAQTQTSEGTGSDIVELFTLKKTISEKAAVKVEEKPLTFWEKIIGPYYWYATGVLSVLLLTMILLLLHLEQKRRAKIKDVKSSKESIESSDKQYAKDTKKNIVLDIKNKKND